VTDLRRAAVCIGHSHVEAIEAAAAQANVPLHIFNIWRFTDAPYGRGTLQAVRERRSQLLGPVFSFVGGGLPQQFGMIAHPVRPYDFVWPEQPDIPLTEGAEIVPYEAVHDTMKATIAPFLQTMEEIRQLMAGAVFHIESPPPCEEEIVANQPDWAAIYGTNDVIAPIWFRYKLWQLHSRILRAHCDSMNIEFIAHPREAVDERGFLLPQLRGRPGHGNAAYGALVLLQMRSRARDMEGRMLR
jgi:hypothetical protein